MVSRATWSYFWKTLVMKTFVKDQRAMDPQSESVSDREARTRMPSATGHWTRQIGIRLMLSRPSCRRARKQSRKWLRPKWKPSWIRDDERHEDG